MVLIANIEGVQREIDCMGCAMAQGEILIPGGSLLRTEHFDAHQDYEIPIPGFIILASLRHIDAVDQFTEDEQKDFLGTLVHVRKAMREALGITTAYLIQEEDSRHHFHVWLLPRYAWMEEKFGKKIQSVQPIMEYSKDNLKTGENLSVVRTSAEQLRQYLQHGRYPIY